MRLLTFLFVFVSLGSCASIEEYTRAACHSDAAYTSGLEDGQNGRSSRATQFAQCSENKDLATQKYREGFEKGSQNLLGSTQNNDNKPSDTNKTIHTGVNIIINSPGASVRGDARVGEPKNFYCSIEVFMKKYEAFGPTLLQAKKAVIDECIKHHSRIHCSEEDDDLSCKRNL